jgi:fluoride exporter
MAESLHSLIWVALGSAFGGAARYFLSGLVGRNVGETFPWGTLAVNVSGCFAVGLLAVAGNGSDSGSLPAWWSLAVVGFLGSYTTVSSFSLQTLTLARDGEFLRSSGNTLLSLVLCLAAVALGFSMGVILGMSAP